MTRETASSHKEVAFAAIPAWLTWPDKRVPKVPAGRVSSRAHQRITSLGEAPLEQTEVCSIDRTVSIEVSPVVIARASWSCAKRSLEHVEVHDIHVVRTVGIPRPHVAHLWVGHSAWYGEGACVGKVEYPLEPPVIR